MCGTARDVGGLSEVQNPSPRQAVMKDAALAGVSRGNLGTACIDFAAVRACTAAMIARGAA